MRRAAEAAEAEALQAEWARHETVMHAIVDASSAEGAVAKRALHRTREFITELGLEGGLSELAYQVRCPYLVP